MKEVYIISENNPTLWLNPIEKKKGKVNFLVFGKAFLGKLETEM